MAINIGTYNLMKVQRKVEFGVYLDDGDKGILLPNRWVPEETQVGDELKVFIGYDSEDRLIATTLIPKAIVGEIAYLRVRTITSFGAFLDLGIMKDLFVPIAFQQSKMIVGNSYFVSIGLDERTNRMVGNQWFEKELKDNEITLKELELVSAMVYRKTNLGYAVIINHRYLGLIHANEIFKSLEIGKSYEAFIKKIDAKNKKIDVVIGKPGYQKVESEIDVILRLLKEKNGSLPYNDKTSPEIIYQVFGMSKKTFKMALGNLYRQQKITFAENGHIQLVR